MLDDRGQADIDVGEPQRTDDVSEIALGEALIVRLGEDFGRKQLVRDLGIRAAGVRVVNDVAERLPRQEPATMSRRSLAELSST